MSNYPPEVTGSGYEIAGPDYEKEIEGECPICGNTDCLIELGYRRQRWVCCAHCDYQKDIEEE